MSREAACIVAKNLGKTYRVSEKEPGLLGTVRHLVIRQTRDVEAVKAVSFEVAPGEMVGFLGPNGAGKTTTLKMLSGLIRPSRGEARVNGFEPFARQRAFLQEITLVMGQKQQLIWDLPCTDSIRINAAIYEVPPDEVQPRIDEVAEMLGLSAQLKKPVRKLSLGERMKAELLAALLHRPKVLFLDEPTIGLDVNAQVAMRTFLKEYNARYGATVLISSHDMADITALCSRVLLIGNGELVFDGALQALLEAHAPYREVTVRLSRSYQREHLEDFANIETYDGAVARFSVAKETLTQTVSRLLSELEVEDLSVGDPAVEDIIGRVFNEAAKREAS